MRDQIKAPIETECAEMRAAPLAFSLTESGALDQASHTGTGSDVTIHLAADAPIGLLSVTRR